jgi:hypothetical protein
MSQLSSLIGWIFSEALILVVLLFSLFWLSGAL